MANALSGYREPARQQKEFVNTNIFKGGSLGSVKTIRPLSYPDAHEVYPFNYPVKNLETGKTHTETISMQGRWFVSELVRPTIERKLLDAYSRYRKLIQEDERLKLEMNGLSGEALENELKKVKVDFFGNSSVHFACEAYYETGVQQVELKGYFQDPSIWHGSKGKINMNLAAQIGLVINDMLVHTPFVSTINFHAKHEVKTPKGNAVVWVPEYYCPKQASMQLPASFVRCAWCHPEDIEIVQKALEAGQGVTYRDYPDENGDLVYISCNPEDDPIRVNLKDDWGIEIPEEELEQIRNRKPNYTFEPVSQLSMMGGLYIQVGDKWVEVSQSDVESMETGEYVEGLPKINHQDYGEVQVQWREGRLWKKPVNPYREHAPLKYPDKLYDICVDLGIPVVDSEGSIAQEAPQRPVFSGSDLATDPIVTSTAAMSI